MVRDAAEYIVKLALSGRRDILKALELYVAGYGPSTIARVLGIPRATIRSFIQRINDRTVFVDTHRFLRLVLPFAKTIEPIVDGNKCLLCNKRFESFSSLLVHISFRHRKLVDLYVNRFFVYAKLGGVYEAEGEKSWDTSTYPRNH
jgi:hypothetical protein